MSKENRQFKTPNGLQAQIGDILSTDGVINEFTANSDAYLILQIILLVSAFQGSKMHSLLLGIDKSKYKKECVHIEDEELDHMSFIESGTLNPFSNSLVIDRSSIYDIIHRAREADRNRDRYFSFRSKQIHTRKIIMDTKSFENSGKLFETGIRIRDIKLWPVSAIHTWICYNTGASQYDVDIINDEILRGNFAKAMELLNTALLSKEKRFSEMSVKLDSKTRGHKRPYKQAHSVYVTGNNASTVDRYLQSSSLDDELIDMPDQPLRISTTTMKAYLRPQDAEVVSLYEIERGRGRAEVFTHGDPRVISLELSVLRYNTSITINFDQSYNDLEALVDELSRSMGHNNSYIIFDGWLIKLLSRYRECISIAEHGASVPNDQHDLVVVRIFDNEGMPMSAFNAMLCNATVEDFENFINYNRQHGYCESVLVEKKFRL